MLLSKKAAFGLGKLSDDAIRKISLNAQERITAHWGDYADEQLPNGLKIVNHVTPHRWDEDAIAVEVKYVQPNFSFDVNTEMSFVIDNNSPIAPIHDPKCIWMRSLTDKREYGRPVPVKVVHPWLLPSFMSIEQVRLKVFLVADQISVRRPGNLDDQTQIAHAPQEFISLKSIMGKYCTEENEDGVHLLAELIDSRQIPSTKLPQLEGTQEEAFMTEPMRLLTCRTIFGDVSVLTREELLSNKSKELITKPGMIVSVSGLLVGDARAGELTNGALWSEVTVAQILRNLAYNRALRIISSHLRRNSILSVNGEYKAQGIEATIAALRPLVYENYAINYSVIRNLDTKIPQFALVFRDKADKRFMHWIVPVAEKNLGYISEIHVETKFNKYETLVEGVDIAFLLNPSVAKLTAYSSKKKSEEEQKENKKFIFEGDEEAFPKKHEEDMDGVFSAMGENEEDFRALLGPVIEEAKLAENSCKQVAGEEIFTLNSSLSWGAQRMAFYIAKDPVEKKAVLKMQIPKFEGITCKAKVLATCAWPSRIGGEVALAIGDTSITAVVPDFYLRKSLLQPGKELYFRISGSVETLELQSVKSFTISDGPLYENELSQFLKDNPDKTENDFPGVEISTEGMQVIFPKEYSTYFELGSPVLSLEETKFLGTKIFKMKIILHRFGDEEMYMNLYAAQSQMPAGLKVGSGMVGIVRLYAEPLEVQLN